MNTILDQGYVQCHCWSWLDFFDGGFVDHLLDLDDFDGRLLGRSVVQVNHGEAGKGDGENNGGLHGKVAVG